MLSGTTVPLLSIEASRPAFMIVMGLFLLVVAWRLARGGSGWASRLLVSGAALLAFADLAARMLGSDLEEHGLLALREIGQALRSEEEPLPFSHAPFAVTVDVDAIIRDYTGGIVPVGSEAALRKGFSLWIPRILEFLAARRVKASRFGRGTARVPHTTSRCGSSRTWSPCY